MGALPDCRARRATSVVRGLWRGVVSLNWVPIYCANCGAPGGRVPEDTTTFAFWLCDGCFEKHGAIAGTTAVSDEDFWSKLKERL